MNMERVLDDVITRITALGIRNETARINQQQELARNLRQSRRIMSIDKLGIERGPRDDHLKSLKKIGELEKLVKEGVGLSKSVLLDKLENTLKE